MKKNSCKKGGKTAKQNIVNCWTTYGITFQEIEHKVKEDLWMLRKIMTTLCEDLFAV